MTFEALWDRLHREHGRAAIVGTAAASADDSAYRTSGSHDLLRIEHAAGSLAGKDVLDYGCGDGRIADPVAAVARHLVCADASGDVLARCKDRLAGRSNVDFARVEWPRDLPAGTFDVAYAMSVAYHLTDLETYRLMQDLLPRLRPGGCFVFDFCNVANRGYDSLILRKITVGDWKQPWPWVVQSADAIERVALLLGYTSVDVLHREAMQPIVVCWK